MIPKNVRFTTKFQKQYSKSPPKIRRAFEFRLSLFLENRDNPLLNNHVLQGKLKGMLSINISGDWRALYSINTFDGHSEYVFQLIGTHSQLYG